MDPALTIALAAAAGVVVQSLAHHLRLPGIVLLLGAGVLLGPDVLGVVQPETMGSALQILVGFAGGTADAMALLERFEGMLKKAQGNLRKASVDLAKEWRTDRLLRRLESILLVADKDHTLLVSGLGDVIEPDDGVAGIGSGGAYAVAAARAFVQNSKMPAREIVEKSLIIASDLCVYTNGKINVDQL